MLTKSPFEEYRSLCGEPSQLRSLVAHFVQSITEDEDSICTIQQHSVLHRLPGTSRKLTLGAWWFGEPVLIGEDARPILGSGYHLYVEEERGSMGIRAFWHQLDEQDPEDPFIAGILAPFTDRYGTPDYSSVRPE